MATAGAFPMKRGDASSALYGFKRRQGKAPSFSAALGHDAATLARVAERALPEGRAEDTIEVQYGRTVLSPSVRGRCRGNRQRAIHRQ